MNSISANKEAVILHTVEDAKEYVSRKIDGRLLLSTNPSVDKYLKYETNLESICLSSFLTYEQIKAEIDNSVIKTEKIIQQLDELWSSNLMHIEQINGIRIFNTLYSFVIRYMYAPYWTILKAIHNAVIEYDIQKILIYNLQGFSLLGCKTSFIELMQCLEDNIPVDIICQSKEKKTNLFTKALRAPNKAVSYLFSKVRNNNIFNFDKSRETVLICESLYDLDFIVKKLDGFNIVYYKNNALLPSPKFFKLGEEKKRQKIEFLPKKELNTFDDLIANEIVEHFIQNIDAYIESIQYLDAINQKYPIQIGITGNAATYGIKPLIIEYLRKKTIPTVISQHGFNYGIQDPYGMHIYSDFNRCDFFISYGFENKDLETLYKNGKGKIKCKIFPFGSTRLKPIGEKGKKKVDLIYPLMNTISLFHQGLFRIKPEILTDIQETLLLYLDSKKGFNIIVKPFLNYNDSNCSVIPVLKRLKTVKVIDNIHFKESFSKFDMKSVLIDHISSPMAEAIPYDVEIFTLGSRADGINKDALSILKKRVHYSENVDELIDLIDKQLSNKLSRKRDQSFMDKYLLKENTEQNIQNFIMNYGTKSCAVL